MPIVFQLPNWNIPQSMKDKCTNCDSDIGHLELPHIWNGKVVCETCFYKLCGSGQNQLPVASEPKKLSHPDSVSHYQKQLEQLVPPPEGAAWYGKMVCMSCAYVWQSRRSSPPAKCPHCHKTTVAAIRQNSPKAQLDILRIAMYGFVFLITLIFAIVLLVAYA
ncbi:MAG TPA: hypothetical protein VG722_05620 [Tepidisphaeraceae bacterium]|nr:hypothetical protein [Tepidisphaeraceae bacterium]